LCTPHRALLLPAFGQASVTAQSQLEKLNVAPRFTFLRRHQITGFTLTVFTPPTFLWKEVIEGAITLPGLESQVALFILGRLQGFHMVLCSFRVVTQQGQYQPVQVLAPSPLVVIYVSRIFLGVRTGTLKTLPYILGKQVKGLMEERMPLLLLVGSIGPGLPLISMTKRTEVVHVG